jgi:hypothetical protein
MYWVFSQLARINPGEKTTKNQPKKSYENREANSTRYSVIQSTSN